MASLKDQKIIIDLETLNRFNAEGCPACGHKFSLGDVAVPACGYWDGGSKLIHEHEAVYDRTSGVYMERKCWAAAKSGAAPAF